MKANQKFTQADEAVSPVIGVILMVAITVVLAAVVFVLVSDLGDSGESAPSVSFSKNSGAGTVTIVQAAAGLEWGDLAVSGDCAAPAGTGTARVTAGDTVASDCDPGDSVTVIHTPTNSLLYQTTF